MTEIATRNARNRRTGARWQSEFRDGARDAGLDVERLVLTGAEDEGDAVIRHPRIHVPAFLVIENKTGALNPAFVVEAHREAAALRRAPRPRPSDRGRRRGGQAARPRAGGRRS